MEKKVFYCPNCKAKVTHMANPGERVVLTCPKCGNKALAVFQGHKPSHSTDEITIEINNLSKFYGDIEAVKNVSFNVYKGEIFGFLGPNGAGKTTTIRTLLGYLEPNNGIITIFGTQQKEWSPALKNKIGYVPSDINLYGDMTGNRFLDYFSSLRNVPAVRLSELLEIFDLPLHKKIKEYSQGMKKKIGIIQAFMHDPELIIMDEPTSGLDPLVQQTFYRFLFKEKQKGKTIFFSSHVLSEVEKLCDRVGIIRKGKLIALENIETLKKKKGKIVKIKVSGEINKIDFPDDVKIINDTIEFIILKDIDKWMKVINTYTIEDIDISNFKLEDIFMNYYEEAK